MSRLAELPPLPRPAPAAVARIMAGMLAPRKRTPVVECPSIPGYEIRAMLGRGGTAVVYRAMQTKPRRQVALKVMPAGAHAEPGELARFRAEAETVAGLAHPNIVQIYEVGEQDGWVYLALEYVNGGSLADRIAGTPQPAAWAAQLMEQLARAVHFVHERGVVHRDLKPANVLLSSDGTPKITDFGLAGCLRGEPGRSATGGDTQTGDILGTPSYMAPEQARGQTGAIGPPSDVYALGASLYELLTGRPPFKSETALDTLLQARAGEPVPPRQRVPKVPRELEAICLKCLQKEARQRYASAAALAEDLGRFLAGEPVRARPLS
jgi:serine/threonine-protein kinase